MLVQHRKAAFHKNGAQQIDWGVLFKKRNRKSFSAICWNVDAWAYCCLLWWLFSVWFAKMYYMTLGAVDFSEVSGRQFLSGGFWLCCCTFRKHAYIAARSLHGNGIDIDNERRLMECKWKKNVYLVNKNWNHNFVTSLADVFYLYV